MFVVGVAKSEIVVAEEAQPHEPRHEAEQEQQYHQSIVLICLQHVGR